ncbi:hypothetical protein [Actinoplanes sp. NPDC051494]|uniref:hypothetical protein n=1 Tax=Actinoplanes sp. NPDC051494 TaxID=3363907 RepID=UPI00378B4E23
MSYQYTYPSPMDEPGFDGLPDAQRELGRAVNERARDGEHGGDRRLILLSLNVPAEDKAALAMIWGGPDAAKEFLP